MKLVGGDHAREFVKSSVPLGSIPYSLIVTPRSKIRDRYPAGYTLGIL